MIKWLLICFSVFTLASCLRLDGGNVEADIPKPDNLLSKGLLVEAMTEVSVIEAAYSMRHVQLIRYADVISKDIEKYLATKNITKEAYEASIRYYTTQSNTWTEMQKDVAKKLEDKIKDLPEEAAHDKVGEVVVEGEF